MMGDELHGYLPVRELGKGGFATVVEYESTKTGERVAIKQIFLGDQKAGVNIGAIKEIQVLQEIRHPNVIQLLDVFPHEGRIFMVLEKASTDLDKLIRDRALELSSSRIKGILKMILEGVAHCHDMWFMHRDIKPENILIMPNGCVKLGDFGHATALASEDREVLAKVTDWVTVITKWYRPPELLYGAFRYSEKVDVWSVGCIFAEMVIRSPIFRADDDTGSTDVESDRIRQLQQVFRLCGTPSETSWKEAERLPGFIKFSPQAPADFSKIFPSLDPHARDLLRRMLTMDPGLRISSRNALKHLYFSSEPAPASMEDIAAMILTRK